MLHNAWVRVAVVVLVVGGGVGVAVALSGDGRHAPAVQQRRALSAIVEDYRRAHADAAAAQRGGGDRAVRHGAPVWRAARICVGDWRAAPEERKGELFDLYRVAAAQPSLPAEIAAGRSWLATLRAIPDLERVPRLLQARRRLAGAVDALATLRATGLDPCAVVGSWRRVGWSAARKPAALRRVQRALDELSAAEHGAPLIDLGVPDALNACEPVFEALAPEDSFCG